MKRIKLIVGLGNPSFKYKYNRHNVGTWFINKIVKKYGIFLQEKKNF